MDRSLLVRIAITVLAGCEKRSVLYCGKHSDPVNCSTADSGTTCTSSAQCSNQAPICNTISMTCVECVASTDCPLTAPICGGGNRCHGCSDNAECSSNACLPGGSCASESLTAYVSASGNDSNNTTCVRSAMCKTIDHALGVGKPIIKLTGPATYNENLAIGSGSVTLLSDPMVKVTDSSGNPQFAISGDAQVTLAGFQIAMRGSSAGCVTLTNTASLTLHRMKIDTCDGFAISTTGGSLTIERSLIRANISGGLKVAGGTFDITNTMIVKNGNIASNTPSGGAELTCSATCRFEFNTVADNVTKSGQAAGIVCDFPLAAPNNIIAHNRLGQTPIASDTFGACTYPTSSILPDLATLHFVSPTDYHIGSGSVALDTALTPSSIDVDGDGDHRPQGPEKDQGADEFR